MKPIASGITPRVIAILFLLFISSGSFAQSQEMVRAPAPTWVVDIKVEAPETIPEDQVKDGVYYLLSDRQMKIGDTAKAIFYSHYADYIVNQNGLDGSSQITISFDPNYQTLTFHRLQLIREGRLIDKIHTAKYSVFQREQEMEKLIYDGRLSANIILDDVRVGDVVEYSFSIEGSNPVYANNFSTSFYTQWSVPLAQQFVRILWEKEKPLQLRAFNNSAVPDVNPHANGVEYVFTQKDITPLLENSQTPYWYDPYPWVMVTDSQSWRDVVDWAQPLYDSAVQINGDIEAIAARITGEHKTPKARIHAALAFVQSDIRYLGLEMGENSHKPSPAAETLSRRYGDCKDKAVLLLSLLKAMNIPASAALVNTTAYKTLANYPPSATAFDHVIVHLRHDNKDWWLDPTRQFQQSSLDTLYQPDFGYALLIAPGEKALTSMAGVRHSKLVVKDEFDLTEGAKGKGIYSIATHYYGREAERQRNSLASSSNSETAEQYLNFYKNYFPNITSLAPLLVVDENDDSSLSVAERYQIDGIWEEGKENRFTVDFYANSIGSAVVQVEETKRKDPFAIHYPHHVVQTIRVKLADRGWSFDAEKVVERNPFFEYSSEVKFDQEKNILTLHYNYKALTDQVPAEKISSYIKARKKVMDDIEYSIFERLPGTEPVPDEDMSWVWLFIVGLVAYIVLVFLAIASWVRAKARSKPFQYLRYALSVAICIPPLLLVFGGSFGFFPSTHVATGEELSQRDIKFLQRSAGLPVDEKILYFYSDDAFDMRKDGNGLTEKRIFSYWRDEDGSFSVEQAELKDIERFEFTDAESLLDNATLKVYREDGTNFFLYLSVEGGVHKKFLGSFHSRWRKARMADEGQRAFSEAAAKNPDLKVVRKAVRRLMAKALFSNDLESQLKLADFYSQGVVIQQNVRRALYFYERAAAQDDTRALTALAWHLAVADSRIQDPQRALGIAHDLLEQQDSARVREVVAAANAAAGDYARAQAEQQRAIKMMNEKELIASRAAEKLVEYQHSRPWIELWPEGVSARGTGNSDYVPVLKAAPDYPKRASADGVSGHILFSFDVLHNGTVSNIKVEAEQPAGYFEEAGREALKQFVYMPKLVDGKAVAVEGVKNRFVFELPK